MATYADTAWNAWTTATNSSTVSSSCTSVDTTWYTWNGSTYVQEGQPVYGVDVGQPQPVPVPNYVPHIPPPFGIGPSERDVKAEQLLLSHLDRKQKSLFKKESKFVVTGQSGRKYSIHFHRNVNVHLLDKDGSTLHRLCVINSEIPVADQLLAQKLMLEHNESLFLNLAHWFNPMGSAIPRPAL